MRSRRSILLAICLAPFCQTDSARATVLRVDVSSGTMIWVNTLASPLGIAAYSITEDNSGLISVNWLSLAGNYDSAGSGSVDPVNAWAILDNNNAALTEFGGGTLGAAWLSPGQRVHLGVGVWTTGSPQGDLHLEYVNDQNQWIAGQIEFGNFDLLTADFDEDGDIDGSDFLAWQIGFGTASSAALSAGDADANSLVDSADFSVWQSQFGTTAAASGATPPRSSTAIPEPAAGVLAALFAVVLLRLRRTS